MCLYNFVRYCEWPLKEIILIYIHNLHFDCVSPHFRQHTEVIKLSNLCQCQSDKWKVISQCSFNLHLSSEEKNANLFLGQRTTKSCGIITLCIVPGVYIRVQRSRLWQHAQNQEGKKRQWAPFEACLPWQRPRWCP